MIICKALRGKGTPLFSYQSPLKRDGLKGCKGGVGGGGCCVLAGHLWLSWHCLWATLANLQLSLAGLIVPGVQAPRTCLVSLLLLARHFC